MTKVFVSGSMKIRKLDEQVLRRLNNILDSEFEVIVGDADGVDSSVQSYLKTHGANHVQVYCTGTKPRNNLGSWKVKNITTSLSPGTREYFTAKDKQMAEDCDFGLTIWDSRSTGTLSNAIELIKKKKKAVVFVNKVREFISLKDTGDLEALLSYMAPTALEKAEEKLGLSKTLDSMKFEQADMFGAQQVAAGDV